MPAIARGHSSDGANPVLELFTPVSGRLVDASAVAFQVFDISDDARRASPVQVFPEAAGTRAVVNTTDPWPAGDKLGTGHVVARWTPGAGASLGLHEVRWFIQATPGAPEQVVTMELDVLAEGAGSHRFGYALVSDLRAEGVAGADATDARLARGIRLASEYVDRFTGRFFEPRAMTLTLDGSGGRGLLLGHPIIAIGDVKQVFAMPAQLGELPVEPSFFRVYNRHLTQGLLDPDDRENPRLEYFHASGLRGPQSVIADGVFGYTDPDGSATGRTPALIRHVTKLLALRELPTMTDLTGRDERQQRWRIVSERTRDQGYDLDRLRFQGGISGDPSIDTILVAFQRPAQLGSA